MPLQFPSRHLLAVGLLLGTSAWAQQPIACMSQPGKPQTCVADTANGVLLIHQISAGACVRGKTWHYDRKAIYVSNGCSADFLVQPHGTETTQRTDPRSSDGYKIHGEGVNAFHTNAIRPAPTASDTPASDAQKPGTPNPQ